MKCTGIAVHSLANFPGKRFIFNMCSFHLFPFSFLRATLCLSLNQTRREQASSDCLATSNTHQTKNRAEDREKRRGIATTPRPSFNNYTEYLLTGGLSLCLLSHPTPLIFPLQHPHHFPSCSVTVYNVVLRGISSHFHAWRKQKKRNIKRTLKIVERSASRHADLGNIEGAIYCSTWELLKFLRASGDNVANILSKW